MISQARAKKRHAGLNQKARGKARACAEYMMRDVQMPCGRRERLAARGSGLAKRARWNEDVVTAAAMNPASFLLFAAGS